MKRKQKPVALEPVEIFAGTWQVFANGGYLLRRTVVGCVYKQDNDYNWIAGEKWQTDTKNNQGTAKSLKDACKKLRKAIRLPQ